MKKTILCILVMTLVLALLTGCGKKALEPQSFVEELLSGARFTDSLNPLDAPVIPIIYEVDEGDYTDAIVYCGTAATGEEIAVFTAKDDASAERLLKAAQTRVDNLVESYKSYGPEAARTLENSVVARSGSYVVVVVCSDSAGAKKICDKYI